MRKGTDYVNGYAIKNRGGYLFSDFAQLRKDLVRHIERNYVTHEGQTWPEHGSRLLYPGPRNIG